MPEYKPYSEKLRDPRWQKKRLEILQRDQFTCVSCVDIESELHVHHGYYAKGLEPWEYPDDTLWTLCNRCHKQAEAWLKEIHELIGLLHPEDLEFLCGDLQIVVHGKSGEFVLFRGRQQQPFSERPEEKELAAMQRLRDATRYHRMRTGIIPADAEFMRYFDEKENNRRLGIK